MEYLDFLDDVQICALLNWTRAHGRDLYSFRLTRWIEGLGAGARGCRQSFASRGSQPGTRTTGTGDQGVKPCYGTFTFIKTFFGGGRPFFLFWGKLFSKIRFQGLEGPVRGIKEWNPAGRKGDLTKTSLTGAHVSTSMACFEVSVTSSRRVKV